MVAWLVEQGFVDQADELTMVRSMGRTFARLTEWEVGEMASAALAGGPSRQKELEELVVSLIPVVEDVQNYVWRRHLAGAAGRLLLRPQGEEGRQTVVGFADIVNFTRRSRSLDAGELSALIESFESTSASIVNEHGGPGHQDHRRRGHVHRRRPGGRGRGRSRCSSSVGGRALPRAPGRAGPRRPC